jgi:oxygen-independent coproporphyrinogen-3 oxidase
MPGTGVYLHIPFCRSRCSYCDFATDVYRSSGAVERYVAALISEIQNSRIDIESAADTVYFGGGTPSLLLPQQVERIIEVVRDRFGISVDTEITMEMNPATVTLESLTAYRSLGVNRASFGVQTFDDTALKLLARGHNADDARNTFKLLREAGFDNISLDLIAGLPGQTLGQWEQNLDEALSLSPEHISLYLLEIHQGTPLAEQIRSGRQTRPDEELAAEMYEMMLDRLGAAGYAQYEISNFSLPGRESRHNSKYWTLDPVFGFGVSAHSFDGRERYANERDTAKYVEMISSSGFAEIKREAVDLCSEYIFLGLRLDAGIEMEDFRIRFGVEFVVKYENEIASLLESELVEIDDDRIRLTRFGKLYSNEVFAYFV